MMMNSSGVTLVKPDLQRFLRKRKSPSLNTHSLRGLVPLGTFFCADESWGSSPQTENQMFTSKCAGCDQHNAVIHHDNDMYCNDCYKQKIIEIECYCEDEIGIICNHHLEESNV